MSRLKKCAHEGAKALVLLSAEQCSALIQVVPTHTKEHDILKDEKLCNGDTINQFPNTRYGQ